MLTDITLGQYFPANSVFHKMDPRAKIILSILLIVFVFIAKTPVSVGFIILSLVALMLVSRVPVTVYLRNIKMLLPIILFTAILNVLYLDEGRVLFQYWIFKITLGGVERSLLIAIRIILLVIASALLTYTTTPTALTDAIERLLSPLRFVGLGSAVHILAMMMTIALRFIPTLIEETEKIISAQKARGADMDSGGVLKRVKAMVPILIPLLISSFRRAYELAEAMEARCYNGGKGRRRMKQLHYTPRDAVMLLITLVICGAVIACNMLFPFTIG